VISSKIWASKAKNSQAKLSIGSCKASCPTWWVKRIGLLEKGARIDSFPVGLPTPGYSSMSEAKCELTS
jgi:hypothetical protein